MSARASVLRAVARKALHHAGGLRLVRSLNRNSLRILMFHSFLPWHPGLADVIERRCRHLKRHYHPISLTEVTHLWHSRRPLPPNALAITVDDGYRDFFEVAYPIFSTHRIPAIVYLVSEFMDGKLWLWPDQLRYAIEHAAPRRFNIDAQLAVDLGTESGRKNALTSLSGLAKKLPNAERHRFMQTLPAAFDVSIPVEPPAQYAPLTWDSVREMAAGGIEFGAHTRTHPILSRVDAYDVLRDEIEGSKLRIERQTGRPVLHFCYPNGRREDISAQAIECVKQAGYQTAVVTEEGFNFPGADEFRLKRIPADPSYPDWFFEEYAAGVHAR